MVFMDMGWWLERLGRHLVRSGQTRLGVFSQRVLDLAVDEGLIGEIESDVYALTPMGFDWASEFEPERWEILANDVLQKRS